ncbi:MAG: response regulator [Fibrobacterota bacterium]
MTKEFYTTGEIAKIIGISEKTVKNYCDSGKIISEKTPITNYRRISRENLANFLKINNLSLDLLKKCKEIKVLVVDDNKSVVEILVEALNEISNDLVIEIANDGYDACIKAGVFIPDIILLDLKMPGADGVEVCKSIRNNHETKHAKIIILSGNVTEENLQYLKEFNPLHILGKPFSVGDVIDKISPLLNDGTKDEGAGGHEKK